MAAEAAETSTTKVGRRGMIAAAAAIAVGLSVRNTEQVAAASLVLEVNNTATQSTKISATSAWSNVNGAAVFQATATASTVAQGTVGLWGIGGGSGGTGVIGNGDGASSQSSPGDFATGPGCSVVPPTIRVSTASAIPISG